MNDSVVIDLGELRPDFQAAAYQFLIGLIQTTFAPEDRDVWRERLGTPPSREALERAFAPVRDAFHLENPGGPAFLQDLNIEGSREAEVSELLFEQGSDIGRFFSKPRIDFGLCPSCTGLALMNLQCHAPSGGRGTRTSLRGGGPITTLLIPNRDDATLWQRLWLNVVPADELGYGPIGQLEDVLPWLAPTRTSDQSDAKPTPPSDVHPLQAYWGMPRRIRLEWESTSPGRCGVCGEEQPLLLRRYWTRHGGVNYGGPWMHPLSPYSLDPKGEKPPIARKGKPGGIGYRDWLALTFGLGDDQKPALVVERALSADLGDEGLRLWAMGGDFDNMKLRAWYDAVMPVVTVLPAERVRLVNEVQSIIESAAAAANFLSARVREAWIVDHSDPIVRQSFWDATESNFFAVVQELVEVAPRELEAAVPIRRRWLCTLRDQAFCLFDQWTVRGPMEALNLAKVVTARGGLQSDLYRKKPMKDLWKSVREPAEVEG
jgi:CRISPR system Cascade subunit CasA